MKKIEGEVTLEILILLVLKIMGYIKWSWFLIIVIIILLLLLPPLFYFLKIRENIKKKSIEAKVYLPNGEIENYVNIYFYEVSPTKTTLKFKNHSLIFSNVPVVIIIKDLDENDWNS